MVTDSVTTKPYLTAPREDRAISQPALKRVFLRFLFAKQEMLEKPTHC